MTDHIVRDSLPMLPGLEPRDTIALVDLLVLAIKRVAAGLEVETDGTGNPDPDMAAVFDAEVVAPSLAELRTLVTLAGRQAWPGDDIVVAWARQPDAWPHQSTATTKEMAALAHRLPRVLCPWVALVVDVLDRRIERGQAWVTERRERGEGSAGRLVAGTRAPSLHVGLTFVDWTLHDKRRVTTELRRGLMRGGVTPNSEQHALLRDFEYLPLRYSELLVLIGLVNLARDAGKLDEHPWATHVKPITAQPDPRIRISWPGYSELARRVGYEPGVDGRIPSDARTTLERAMLSLASEPRQIVEIVADPVRHGRGKHAPVKWVEVPRVSVGLYVEMELTAARGPSVTLHPVVAASCLKSYLSLDGLVATYERARAVVGCQRVRDEFATADLYLRWLASVKAGDARLHAADGTLVPGMTLAAQVADETLEQMLGLTKVRRKNGATAARERVNMAMTFAKAVGTLVSGTLRPGAAGPVWDLSLRHPDVPAVPTNGVRVPTTRVQVPTNGVTGSTIHGKLLRDTVGGTGDVA